jgi:streptogramin lyase/alpha-tubulin suppressor-like RCC1 family protein
MNETMLRQATGTLKSGVAWAAITLMALLVMVGVLVAMNSTSANAAPGTVPGTPTNLTAPSKTATSVSLSWTAPATDGGSSITDYKIEHSTNGASWTVFNDGESTSTSETVTGLTRGIPYKFRVSAINALGAGLPVGFVPQKVTTGNNYTCALPGDGTVECLGYNAYGQLGNGTTIDSRNPVTVSGITNAIAITGNWLHTCALLADGTIRCWGENTYGQLGNATATRSTTPVTVSGITNASAIAAGYWNTCALLADRTVQCWGYNGSGQLGNGTTTNSSTPVTVSGIADATNITVGGNVCALLSTGRIKCWGYNGNGELGNGSTTNANIPVYVSGITTATVVSAGTNHTCAVLADQTVRCWGMNTYGQVGNGTNINSATPVNVSGITNAENISGGYGHTCAVLADNTAKCWGWNDTRYPGNGTTTPVAVSGITNATLISAGYVHTCAVLAGSAIKCWGYNGWGYNGYGQLGDGTTNNSTTPVTATTLLGAAVIPAVKPAAPPGLSTLSKTAPTVSLSWDAPDDGGRPITDYKIEYSTNGTSWTVFNDGVSTNTSTNVTGLTRGTSYTFRVSAINAEGTGATSTVTVTPAVVPSAPTSLIISGKTQTSVSLVWTAPDNGGRPITDYKIEYSTDGTAWTLFSDGVSTSESTTVTGLTRGTSYMFRIAATNLEGTSFSSADVARKISTGDAHSCALLADTTIKCWGYNAYGQLGNGTTTNSSTPVTATSGPVVAIPAVVPAAPAPPTITSKTATSISLSWLAPDSGGQPISDYRIEYSSDRTTWFEFDDAVSASTSTSVTGLFRGTAYTFRISAINAEGTSSPSGVSSSVIPAVVPNAPRALTVGSITASSVSLNWTAPDDGGRPITDYGVYYSTYGSDWTRVDDGVTSTTSATIVGLTRGTSYGFLVTAVNTEGMSLGATTSAIPAAIPGSPTSIHAVSKTVSSVSLVWTAPSDDGGGKITDYKIEYSANGSNWYTFPDRTSSSPMSDLTGLTRGATYRFRISAVNAMGTSAASETSSPITAVSPPSAPRYLTVGSITASSISLNWVAPDDDGGRSITGYVISYSTDGSNWTLFNDGATTTSTATITGLTRGVTYQFRVSAVNAEGTGPAGTTNGTPNRTLPSGTPSATDQGVSSPYAIVSCSDGNMWFANQGNNTIGRITAAGTISNFAGSGISTPAGVACGLDGSVWFTNFGNNSIGRVAANGDVSNFVGFGISTPRGIIRGPDGNFWFSNQGNNTIGRIKPSGVITGYSGTGINAPARLAVGGDGNIWFTNSGNDSIGRITTAGVVSNFSAYGVSKPVGITAASDGSLWFTNQGNNSIGQISTSGIITVWSGAGVDTPAGISAGRDGNIWFTNGGNNTIGRITPSGVVTNFTATGIQRSPGIAPGDGGLWFTNVDSNSIGFISFSGAVTTFGGIATPFGIATGSDGSTWFTNARNNTIGRISRAGVTTCYSGTGISVPSFIALGSDGNMWFTNSGNNTIGRITTDGQVSNYAGASINVSFGIARGSDGNMWFTNAGNNTIGRITTDGQVSNYAGASINVPTAIGLGADGNMWFANNGNRTIGRITPSGEIRSYSGVSIGKVDGIVLGPDGNMWFTNNDNDSIGRITPSGQATNFTGPGISQPAGLTLGPDGNLWFANYGNNSLGSITPLGSITNYPASGVSKPSRIASGPGYELWFTSPGNNSIGYMSLATKPDVPAVPRMTGKNATSVSLSWNAPDDGGTPITDYLIEFSADGTNWLTFSHQASAATTATVTDLIQGNSYRFRVSAINSEGRSTATPSSAAITPSSPPTMPSLPVPTSKTETSISIQWNAPTNGGNPITDYRIEYYDTLGMSWQTFRHVKSAATTATVTNLIRGHSYRFRVTAINSEGSSTASPSSVPVMAATQPKVVPAGAGAWTSPSSLSVSWPAPSDGGSAISDYKIEYSLLGVTWTTVTHTASTSTSITIPGLVSTKSYKVRLSALNSEGFGAAATFTLSAATAPGSPTGVSGAAGDGKITVTWVAPTSNGGAAITGFTVTSTPGAKTCVWSSGPLSCVVTGLTNGTGYTFTVTATNFAGTSLASTASGSTTPRMVPQAPMGASSVLGSNLGSVTAAAIDAGGSTFFTATGKTTAFRISPTGAVTTVGSGFLNAAGIAVDSTGRIYVADTGNNRVVRIALNGTTTTVGTGLKSPKGLFIASNGDLYVADIGNNRIVKITSTGVQSVLGSGFSAPSGVALDATGFIYVADTGNNRVVKIGAFGVQTTIGTGYSSPTAISLDSAGSVYVADRANNRIVKVTAAGVLSEIKAGFVNPTGVVVNAAGDLTIADTGNTRVRRIRALPSATAGIGQATITWTAPSFNGGASITGYRVTTVGNPSKTCTTTGATSCIVTGLTKGVSYTFTVVAINEAGSSAASASTTAVIIG